jgi:hypothetical protein
MIARRRLFLISANASLLAFSFSAALAQKSSAPVPQNQPAAEKSNTRAYSGMYTFLKEGEFLQLSIEDEDRVSGFVSRYEDEENEKGTFVDQFFKSAKLDGNRLTFTTQTVNGMWFDFSGAVERGQGKNPGDEGYYVLKGTLTENSLDADKKATSRNHEVEFKMFPQNISTQAR